MSFPSPNPPPPPSSLPPHLSPIMDSGDEPNTPESRPSGRKRAPIHRHTARQTQELEAAYNVCPHPDEKQRMQLSRDLGMEPQQVKFWFQNKRTQMKAQSERADNCSLRAENDKIRAENIVIKVAMKSACCTQCNHGPPSARRGFADEHKLRMENARLKEELDRVSSIASKYLGRPITQLPPIQPIPVSSLDLSVGGVGNPGLGPSLDLDHLAGNTSSSMQYSFRSALSGIEKSTMAEIANNATEELIRLAQTDEPLWMKTGRDILHLETYNMMFPRHSQLFRSPDIRVEASRDSGLVIMNAVTLVDMFMDSDKWVELFPTIVSRAKTIEVLMTGLPGNGSMVLMYEEVQLLSPAVPTYECQFIRCCQQIEPGFWVITDVSVDSPKENQHATSSLARKLPSGCLIQDMSNGCSKVTWVEHVEIEDKSPTHRLYIDIVHSGTAFGAPRRLSTLQRMCERLTCLMATETIMGDLRGVIPSIDGKRNMMRLSQRMVNDFCTSLSTSNGRQWTTLSALNDVGVRLSVHRNTDPNQPNSVVLSASTSIWLPVPSQRIFNFLRDERTRNQWDGLSDRNQVQEIAHISNGSNLGNCISLFRAFNDSQNDMLILQENCTERWGSLVVYSPVDLASVNVVMTGGDPSYISLLPSGFSILPDGTEGMEGGASTSSSFGEGSSGSLVTVAFQIPASSLPSSKLNIESVSTVNNLISTTVQKLQVALNCPVV